MSARHERHERDTSDTSATRVQHERHECYINDTSATQVKYFDKSEKSGKSENIFTPYLLAIWLRITRRGTISFWELTFGNASFPCQNAFEKCTKQTEPCNRKSYIKKLYTRL